MNKGIRWCLVFFCETQDGLIQVLKNKNLGFHAVLLKKKRKSKKNKWGQMSIKVTQKSMQNKKCRPGKSCCERGLKTHFRATSKLYVSLNFSNITPYFVPFVSVQNNKIVKQVQISAVELLSLVCYELTSIVRDSGRGLACYLADLLSRIKLQKITLHCVLTSVNTGSKHAHTHSRSFTHEILAFNEHKDNSLASQSEAFQVQMLRYWLPWLNIM